jgi:glycosyltransferase involved in cell wall biosynthesis
MLIVNDGSRDNSAEIVEAYARTDSRIKLLRQENAGIVVARNNGLRHAKGKYICLLDSDDMWESDFLEEQVGFMKAKNASFVCASYRRIDHNGDQYLRPVIVPAVRKYKDLLYTNTIPCLTAMYDREKLGLHFLREGLKSREDYVYWLDIIKQSNVIVYGNKKILAAYRCIATSNTANKKKQIKPQFMIYYRILKLGLFRSLFYTCTWAFYGFLKYRK